MPPGMFLLNASEHAVAATQLLLRFRDTTKSEEQLKYERF